MMKIPLIFILTLFVSLAHAQTPKTLTCTGKEGVIFKAPGYIEDIEITNSSSFAVVIAAVDNKNKELKAVKLGAGEITCFTAPGSSSRIIFYRHPEEAGDIAKITYIVKDCSDDSIDEEEVD